MERIILIIALIIVPIFAYCQLDENDKNEKALKTKINNQNNRVDLGIKIGSSFFTQRLNFEEEEREPNLGYLLGHNFSVFIDYNFNNNISFRLSPSYSRKGSVLKELKHLNFNNDNYESVPITGYSKFKIDYINLPIHFRLSFNNIGFFIGPYYSIAVNAERDYDYSYTILGDSFERKGQTNYVFGKNFHYDEYNDYEAGMLGTDYGIDLGIDYSYRKFFIEFLFSYGLQNTDPKIYIYELNYESFPVIFKRYNFGFNFSIGYNIL